VVLDLGILDICCIVVGKKCAWFSPKFGDPNHSVQTEEFDLNNFSPCRSNPNSLASFLAAASWLSVPCYLHVGCRLSSFSIH
jgi:hypothetical protein